MIFCKKNLKRSIACAFLPISFMLFGLAHAQDTNRKATPATATTVDNKIRNIDGVAAVVNTGYITRKEIDDRVAALQKQGVKAPDAAEFRKAVLERLIVEKIQMQNAEQEGIKVTNKDLDRIIGDIAAKNKLSYAEFRAKVTASGTSFERYKETLREDVLLTRYREREVDARIKISDAEIDNFIAERARVISGKGAAPSSAAPGAGGGPEEIDVAQIFIPVDPGAGVGTQAEAKKKADVPTAEIEASATPEEEATGFPTMKYKGKDGTKEISGQKESGDEILDELKVPKKSTGGRRRRLRSRRHINRLGGRKSRHRTLRSYVTF